MNVKDNDKDSQTTNIAITQSIETYHMIAGVAVWIPIANNCGTAVSASRRAHRYSDRSRRISGAVAFSQRRCRWCVIIVIATRIAVVTTTVIIIVVIMIIAVTTIVWEVALMMMFMIIVIINGLLLINCGVLDVCRFVAATHTGAMVERDSGRWGRRWCGWSRFMECRTKNARWRRLLGPMNCAPPTKNCEAVYYGTAKVFEPRRFGVSFTGTWTIDGGVVACVMARKFQLH